MRNRFAQISLETDVCKTFLMIIFDNSCLCLVDKEEWKKWYNRYTSDNRIGLPMHHFISPYYTTQIFGGCATVAGWGHRYNEECKTDNSNQSPDKIQWDWNVFLPQWDVVFVTCRFCAESWTNKGKEHQNCTFDDLDPDDLTKPCRLFARELEFIKERCQKKV